MQDGTHAEPERRAAGEQAAGAAEAAPKTPKAIGRLLWGLVILAVVLLQWPMLKGTFYRVAGTEAPKPTVAWRGNFDAAAAEGARVGKPLLLVFSASWCPPCLVMKHDVWPDPEASRAVNGQFIPVLIDADDPRSAVLSRRYEVEGIPAVLVVDADGRVVRRGSYMSKAAAITFLTGP